MIDYMIEVTCIYICISLCFYHVNLFVLIVMSISVKRHELCQRYAHKQIIIIIFL